MQKKLNHWCWFVPRQKEKKTYSNTYLSLSCLRQGTVFLMQVPLRGSTSSTMTNGASSRVTMDRWSSLCSAPEYSSKRGHTWYLIVKEPLSHLPTWMKRVGVKLSDIQATVTGASKGMGRSARWITEEENRNQERGKRQIRGRKEGRDRM